MPAFTFSSLPPLSVYIHLPWCVKKCPYCDFNSHVRQTPDFTGYAEALLRGLEQQIPWVWERQAISLFFGGGTPSLPPSHIIDQIISGLRARLPWRGDIEITLEANPESITPEKLDGWLKAGVNRLSVGVQSFSAQQLTQLGRAHNAKQAITAVKQAKRAGFGRINIDLMFGLPGQNSQQALDDVQQVLDLDTEHLSHYQLTLEEGTPFYRQPPPGLPQDTALWHIQQRCHERLREAGFCIYEVSAWSRTETARCRHNLNVWQFGDYLGLGAGAHGKITLPAEQHLIRTQYPKNPDQHLQGPDPVITRYPSCDDVRFEFLLNALRLRDGFDTSLYIRHTGLPAKTLHAVLQPLQERGLLLFDPKHNHWHCSDHGWLHLDRLLLDCLPA